MSPRGYRFRGTRGAEGPTPPPPPPPGSGGVRPVTVVPDPVTAADRQRAGDVVREWTEQGHAIRSVVSAKDWRESVTRLLELIAEERRRARDEALRPVVAELDRQERHCTDCAQGYPDEHADLRRAVTGRPDHTDEEKAT